MCLCSTSFHIFRKYNNYALFLFNFFLEKRNKDKHSSSFLFQFQDFTFIQRATANPERYLSLNLILAKHFLGFKGQRYLLLI